jgi:hypothetical protein
MDLNKHLLSKQLTYDKVNVIKENNENSMQMINLRDANKPLKYQMKYSIDTIKHGNAKSSLTSLNRELNFSYQQHKSNFMNSNRKNEKQILTPILNNYSNQKFDSNKKNENKKEKNNKNSNSNNNNNSELNSQATKTCHMTFIFDPNGRVSYWMGNNSKRN